MTARAWVLALSIGLCGAGDVLAHKASDSYLTLTASAENVRARWDIALRDLAEVIDLDADGDGRLTWGEVKRAQGAILDYALPRLRIANNGHSCGSGAPAMLVDEHTDGGYVVLQLDYGCGARVESLGIGYSLLRELDAQHRGLVKVSGLGEATSTAVLSSEMPHATFGKARSPLAGVAGFIADGVRHIAIGFDHLLFLVALLLPAVMVREGGRWTPVAGLRPAALKVLGIVTAFTVAHSITLSLGTLGLISLPSRLVESLIALSVVATALDNLKPFLPRRRWQVAFAFGLVHGLGFASVLRELELPRAELAKALFGFNVGVEIGQLALVALVLPLAYALRRTPVYSRVGLAAGSAAIAFIAFGWLAERSLDISLMPF